jgi:hypothetical protein
MLAATARNADLIKWLLAHGANARAVDAAGRSALAYAIIGTRADANDYAGRVRYADIVNALLKGGAAVALADAAGVSPLSLALRNEAGVYCSRDELGVLLSAADARIDAPLAGLGGATPFGYAVMGSHISLGDFLLSRGANPAAGPHPLFQGGREHFVDEAHGRAAVEHEVPARPQLAAAGARGGAAAEQARLERAVAAPPRHAHQLAVQLQPLRAERVAYGRVARGQESIERGLAPPAHRVAHALAARLQPHAAAHAGRRNGRNRRGEGHAIAARANRLHAEERHRQGRAAQQANHARGRAVAKEKQHPSGREVGRRGGKGRENGRRAEVQPLRGATCGAWRAASFSQGRHAPRGRAMPWLSCWLRSPRSQRRKAHDRFDHLRYLHRDSRGFHLNVEGFQRSGALAR